MNTNIKLLCNGFSDQLGRVERCRLAISSILGQFEDREWIDGQNMTAGWMHHTNAVPESLYRYAFRDIVAPAGIGPFLGLTLELNFAVSQAYLDSVQLNVDLQNRAFLGIALGAVQNPNRSNFFFKLRKGDPDSTNPVGCPNVSFQFVENDGTTTQHTTGPDGGVVFPFTVPAGVEHTIRLTQPFPPHFPTDFRFLLPEEGNHVQGFELCLNSLWNPAAPPPPPPPQP